jgi:hypothetical protein
MLPSARVRTLLLITVVCLCSCSWFGSRRPPPPNPSEIIVTGAPRNAQIYIDGAPSGQAATHNDQSQILDVAPGAHKVEIHLNDAVVYREDTYVGPGEHRVVTVLSGSVR